MATVCCRSQRFAHGLTGFLRRSAPDLADPRRASGLEIVEILGAANPKNYADRGARGRLPPSALQYTPDLM